MLTLISLTDLDPFPEPTLVPISINLPILDSHIPLMEKEFEFQLFDLDTTLEPNPTLEPKLDFSESVLVPEPFILEPKSTISSNHILLLDQGIDHNDYEMIF